MESDGGESLWLRAILQPWTGLRLRLTVGVYAAKDVTRIQDSNHPRFPFINLMVQSIPMMPSPPESLKVCLPFIPYLIDDTEEEEEEAVLPGWNQLVRAVIGMFRGNSAPHSKSNMTNLREVMKGDWKADKKSKYSYPEIDLVDDVEDGTNVEGTESPYTVGMILSN